MGGCRKAKTTDQDRDLVFVREMPVVKDSSTLPLPTPTQPFPVPTLPSPPLSPPLIYLYRDDGSDTCSLVARFFMAPKRVPAPYRPYGYAHLNIHY